MQIIQKINRELKINKIEKMINARISYSQITRNTTDSTGHQPPTFIEHNTPLPSTPTHPYPTPPPQNFTSLLSDISNQINLLTKIAESNTQKINTLQIVLFQIVTPNL